MKSMNSMAQLVVAQIAAVLLTVGVFYGAQVLGVSDPVTFTTVFTAVFAVAFVTLVTVFAAVSFASVTAFTAATFSITTFSTVTFATFALVVIALVAAFSIAFAMEKFRLKYSWVLVSFTFEVAGIYGALTIGEVAGAGIAAVGVALLGATAVLGKTRALRADYARVPLTN